MDRALERRLTVVVASAGAGKSVLLSQWVQSRPDVSYVWISLVPADDDAAHLANRLLAELCVLNESFRSLAPLVALGAGGLGRPFIDELSVELRGYGKICVVFDDFHVLENPSVIADLETLIDELPHNAHIVLSSRSEPPSDLSRFRLRGEMTELRQVDLAMTYADSAELLENAVGHRLSADNVSALVDKTEGWAAGLQLAGLTISLKQDADAFVADFSGSDRLVSDYLTQQILRSMPDAQRRGVLQLAALDTMSAELIRDVIDDPDAHTTFDRLARDTQFVIALDDRREWFRFHHLFRDLLRYHLRAELPRVEEQTAERAAQWHLDRGHVGTAVDYLIRTQNWERMLDVVLSRGSDVFERGQLATVVAWLEQVPAAVRAENIEAGLFLGILVGLLGQGARADDILSRIANDPRASFGQVACASAFLAALVQTRPDPLRSIRAARRALELITAGSQEVFPDVLGMTSRKSLETVAIVSGARGYFLNGNFAEAKRWLARGLASDGAMYSLWRINALGALALIEAWAGDLVRANNLATEALETAREVGLLSHWGCADAYVALAHVAIERGEPTQAALALHEALLRADATQRTQQLWVLHYERSLLMEASAGEQQTTTPAGSPPPVVLDRLNAQSVRLNRAGKVSTHRATETGRAGDEDAAAVWFERALSALAQNRREQFVFCFEKVEAGDGSQIEGAIQYRLLSALDPSHGAQSTRSTRCFNEALDLADAQGSVELLVRAGPEVISRIAASTHASPGFREKVLQRAKDAEIALPGSDLDEPLTRRELEILSYLPSRYTNNELAEMSFVSVSTIKTHVLHIYQKLGVGTRKEAIDRARELGLL
ncbi:LuxR C-terminal-related transcriptional regulator [Subtercola endophyticus]|uniref:LuxR C-terminal-related transcriptional regulator n=1 Tax=Subtercola endophyticus TaxID=2895559 RepID=UPI001E38F533|nr:LuxR C-terminal-related transcriptional regulator [Subtercola endophyticus]UFS59562.1 LuxR C-terminal-related transcriptional regulator [Subtercola endophyticus]